MRINHHVIDTKYPGTSKGHRERKYLPCKDEEELPPGEAVSGWDWLN